MGQIGHEWIAVAHGWRSVFIVASGYCFMAALAVVGLYRAPQAAAGGASIVGTGLGWRELGLTVTAAIAWGVFNAGYVIYLTFAPLMAEHHGYGDVAAAAIISIGSWIMIFSGAACGQVADRTGRPDMVLYICMAGAVISLAALTVPGAEVSVSVAFGLIGMAPAGVIMALTSQALPPERRAFGMGVFFTVYYLIMTVTAPVAGWLYDRSSDAYDPILLGMALFAAVVIANLGFRAIQRMPSIASGEARSETS